jgi:hypothetical protein
MDFFAALKPPKPTPGYDIYWSFASKRQQMYMRRLDGTPGELTDDPVLANNRFTNAYRASDRVSQYLITNVIYDSERSWVDTFARVLIFKMFNRIATWDYLVDQLGDITAEHLTTAAIDDRLARIARRQPLYSAAYIMPPPRNQEGPKFRRHLSLIREMLSAGAHERIGDAATMADAFGILASYESVGPFLAYQFVTDLNYTAHLSFSEGDFVIPGPGALRGIRKCIADPGDLTPSDVIRWAADAQASAFAERDLPWQDLWGRDLQLIDAQNLFCEVDKYTREAHPELARFAPGTRIKQRYRRVNEALTAWFPPKWGVNSRIPTTFAASQAAHKMQLALS